MKIPTPSANLTQLYDNLAAALNALEEAGERPLRGFTIFGGNNATAPTGTTGSNGNVQRIGETWVSNTDFSDLLHNEDGTHRDVIDQAAGTFANVRKLFDEEMPAHLAEHKRLAD